MNKKIATVVVTYNRKTELLRNIKQQMSQEYPIKYIYIIDNCSKDGTQDFLQAAGILDDVRIRYILLKENIGGAGGFELGLREAMKSDAEYFVLMDDDGYFMNEKTLSNLVREIPAQPECMINSLVLCDEEKLSFGLNDIATKTECECRAENNLLKGEINPFNGTLVSRALVEKIGYPNGQFFIRGDEVDYIFRAREVGAFLATIIDSLYYHPATAQGDRKTIFGKVLLNDFDKPWKEYYGVRNSTYRLCKHSKRYAYRQYKKRQIALIFFDVPDKKKIRQFMRLGYKHGKKGILGKLIQPGQDKL